MEIIGYSERGAMNALFYGMALNGKGDSQMVEFLRLAKIECPESFSKFEVYNEFSLSEFGSPDLVIIAQKGNNSVAFFVEAKVSDGTSFDIGKQKTHHEEYIDDGQYVSGHASNLFFQFRLKHYFFKQKDTIIKDQGGSIGESKKIETTKDRNGEERYRKIGDNPVVIKFADKISHCTNAYYIAIIPQQNQPIENPKDLPKSLKIYYVSWEEIYKSEILGSLLEKTFDFNKDGDVSQILNKPKTNK
jgi:hypothetical protein